MKSGQNVGCYSRSSVSSVASLSAIAALMAIAGAAIGTEPAAAPAITPVITPATGIPTGTRSMMLSAAVLSDRRESTGVLKADANEPGLFTPADQGIVSTDIPDLGDSFPQACWDPTNPPSPEVMAMVNSAMQGYFARYNQNNRWPGAAGSPITLTWSFVPDGLNIPAAVPGESSGNSVLFAQMDAKFGGNRALWIAQFQASFDRWAQLTGLQFTRVSASGVPWDDGAVFASGSLGFGSASRGDMRIAGRNIDGGNGILAYCYFPNPGNSTGGNMVMDTSENWGNSGNSYRFLRNTVLHELGHGVGMFHVCPSNGTKLMEPFLNTGFDGPQEDDVRGVQDSYGDSYEFNNSAGSATVLGSTIVGGSVNPSTGSGVSNVTFTSIDNDGDVDYFRSSVALPILADIVVTPVGTIYDSSTQNGDGSCNSGSNINALAIAPLGVDLFAADGTTLLMSANAVAGTPVTLSGAFLSPAGNYFVRVRDNGTPTQSQLYNLNIAGTVTPFITASDGTSGTEVALNCTTVPGATTYTYFRNTVNNRGTASVVVSGSSPSNTDATAVPGTTYFYWAEATRATGGSRPLAGPDSGFRANLAPANDLCANAITVTTGPTVGTTANSTTDGSTDCIPGAGLDVWYTFNPTCSGVYRIDTCGSAFDTVLSVHSACPGTAANSLVCDDDAGGPGGAAGCSGNTLTSAVNVFLNSGTAYKIRVAGYPGFSGIANGAFTLNIAGVAPSNDTCANAIPVGNGDFQFSNCLATTDFSSTVACRPGFNDVWFRYTAPCDGTVSMNTCDSNMDTLLMVYGDACPSAATVPLACNDDTSGCGLGGTLGSRLTFEATAGTIYTVRLAGFSATASSSRGGGTLSIDCASTCSPCAADYNQDGGVDGADVDVFFADWVGSAPCADVNLDGGIDGSDVDVFFFFWSAGGC
jgi:serralysin